jgi:hypothetical protein
MYSRGLLLLVICIGALLGASEAVPADDTLLNCNPERIYNVSSCFPEYTVDGYIPYCFNTIVLCTASCFSSIWTRSDCLNVCFSLTANLDQYQVKQRVRVELLPLYSQCILSTISDTTPHNYSEGIGACKVLIYGESGIVLEQQRAGVATEQEAIDKKLENEYAAIVGCSVGLSVILAIFIVGVILILRLKAYHPRNGCFLVTLLFFTTPFCVVIANSAAAYQKYLLLTPTHHVDDASQLIC